MGVILAHTLIAKARIVGTTCVNCSGIKINDMNTWNWETRVSAAALVISLLCLCLIFLYFIYKLLRSKKEPQSLTCAEWDDNETNEKSSQDKSCNGESILPEDPEISFISSFSPVIVFAKSNIDGLEDSSSFPNASIDEMFGENNFIPTSLFKDARSYGLQTSMATWNQQTHQKFGITLV